jgi:hypothetical protein
MSTYRVAQHHSRPGRKVAKLSDAAGAFLVRTEYDATRGWVAGQSVIAA